MKGSVIAIIVIVVLAAIAVFSITTFYTPGKETAAGKAWYLYNASAPGGLVEQPGNFYFIGNDGRNYTLGALAMNVRNCQETDKGLDSTKFSRTTANMSGMGTFMGNDSCLSDISLLEYACGYNVYKGNEKVVAAMNLTRSQFNNTILLFGISSGETKFKLKTGVTKTSWGYCENGAILWSDNQCIIPGTLQCFQDILYVCGNNSKFSLKQNCSASGMVCSEDGISCVVRQCAEQSDACFGDIHYRCFDGKWKLFENCTSYGMVCDNATGLCVEKPTPVIVPNSSINVSSSPLGAEVYYRNMTTTNLTYAGLTPVTISVPNGTYILNITYNNTISNISVVTIETGQNVTKFYNFTTNQTGNFTGNQSGNQT